jgi:hypothetical protein
VKSLVLTDLVTADFASTLPGLPNSRMGKPLSQTGPTVSSEISKLDDRTLLRLAQDIELPQRGGQRSAEPSQAERRAPATVGDPEAAERRRRELTDALETADLYTKSLLEPALATSSENEMGLALMRLAPRQIAILHPPAREVLERITTRVKAAMFASLAGSFPSSFPSSLPPRPPLVLPPTVPAASTAGSTTASMEPATSAGGAESGKRKREGDAYKSTSANFAATLASDALRFFAAPRALSRAPLALAKTDGAGQLAPGQVAGAGQAAVHVASEPPAVRADESVESNGDGQALTTRPGAASAASSAGGEASCHGRAPCSGESTPTTTAADDAWHLELRGSRLAHASRYSKAELAAAVQTDTFVHCTDMQVGFISTPYKHVTYRKDDSRFSSDCALVRHVSDPLGALPSPKRHAADFAHQHHSSDHNRELHHLPNAVAEPTRARPNIFYWRPVALSEAWGAAAGELSDMETKVYR